MALVAVLRFELRYDDTNTDVFASPSAPASQRLVFARTVRCYVPAAGEYTVELAFNLSGGDLHLWWPHTHGYPHLYTALTTVSTRQQHDEGCA